MAVVNTLIGHIKGPKGDTGETGATGATGAAGADATVSVGSTTTVPYGQAARVTNTGTPGAAVLNFTIPQGRPGEQTTKLDALTLDALTEPSTAFPVPAVGDNGSTLFGKISKWFSDMSALVATKLNVANVVNNLTTTASGYALDARQGKALNDKFAVTTEQLTQAYGTFMAKRSGNIVIYQWNGNSTVTPSTAAIIGTLSALYRPGATTVITARNGNNTTGYLSIATNGDVSLQVSGTAWSSANGATIPSTVY